MKEAAASLSPALQRFVEDMGVHHENMGMPRMAGRIIGYLLICRPEEQPVDAIASALQASRASISTMTRLLINAGVVERVSRPGERKDFFRAVSGRWEALLERQQRDMAALKTICERGIGLLEKEDPAAKARLQELHEFLAWFENVFPTLLQDFKKGRKTPEHP